MEICRRIGFNPEITHEANNVNSILRLVERGLGVSIVPASLIHQYQNMNISFTELNMNAITTEVVLVHKAHHQNPLIDYFIEKFSAFYKAE